MDSFHLQIFLLELQPPPPHSNSFTPALTALLPGPSKKFSQNLDEHVLHKLASHFFYTGVRSGHFFVCLRPLTTGAFFAAFNHVC